MVPSSVLRSWNAISSFTLGRVGEYVKLAAGGSSGASAASKKSAIGDKPAVFDVTEVLGEL